MFWDEMSVYEIISCSTAVLAFFRPEINKFFRNIFYKPEVKYYANGIVDVNFDITGCYIRLDGAIEAKNKRAIIRKIRANITKDVDDTKLKQIWDTFIYPATQTNSMGQSNNMYETVHPFSINENNIIPAFIKFKMDGHSVEDIFYDYGEELNKFILRHQLNGVCDLNTMCREVKEEDFYKKYLEKFRKECIWQNGTYTLELILELDNISKSFYYKFELTLAQAKFLEENLEYILLIPIFERFHCMCPIKIINAKIQEFNKNN